MAGTGLPKVLAEIMIWYLILMCVRLCMVNTGCLPRTLSTLALESTLLVDLEFIACLH